MAARIVATQGPASSPGVEAAAEAERGPHGQVDLVAAATKVLRTDLSGVQIRSDRFADGVNRAIGSRAVAFGDHIFLRAGELNTGSVEGRKLLAHELAHVAQQRRDGPRPQAKFSVGSFSFRIPPGIFATLRAQLPIEKELIQFMSQMNDSDEAFSLFAIPKVLSIRSDEAFRAQLVATMTQILNEGRVVLGAHFDAPNWRHASEERSDDDGFNAARRRTHAAFKVDERLVDPQKNRPAGKQIEFLVRSAPQGSVTLDCGATVSLAIYYSLVQILGPWLFHGAFFGKQGEHSDRIRLTRPTSLLPIFLRKQQLRQAGSGAVAELLPGDVVYFRNVEGYEECAGPVDLWYGEWAVHKGGGIFMGIGLEESKEFTYDLIEEKLRSEAEKRCATEYGKEDVPGLRDRDGKAYVYRLDMQALWGHLARAQEP